MLPVPRLIGLALSTSLALVLAPGCSRESAPPEATASDATAPGAAANADDATRLIGGSSTVFVTGQLTARVVVTTLAGATPLVGARVPIDDGDLHATGPRGGTEVHKSFSVSLPSESCRTETASVCADAPAYFRRCQTVSMLLCGRPGSPSSSVDVRLGLPEIAPFVHGMFVDVLGRDAAAGEEEAWRASAERQSPGGVARAFLYGAEGRRVRLARFFSGFRSAAYPSGLAYGDGDLDTGMALFAAGRDEEATFSALLKARGIKANVLRTGAYLRIVETELYERYLRRAPTRAELNAGLTRLAKSHNQANEAEVLIGSKTYLTSTHSAL